MNAWGSHAGVGEKFVMIADPDADLTRAMGLDTDVSAFGLGTRSERYAALLRDGVITTAGRGEGVCRPRRQLCSSRVAQRSVDEQGRQAVHR